MGSHHFTHHIASNRRVLTKTVKRAILIIDSILVLAQGKTYYGGNMQKIIGGHPALVSTLERVVGLSLEDNTNILLVDVEAFVANKTEVVATIESGLPVIFYGLDTLDRFIASGMSAAPYSHLRNTGYIQLQGRNSHR